MKKFLLIAAAAGLLLMPVTAIAASPQAGQCDGYNDPANTKIDTSNDDLVLEAGLTVCIHASNGNTGQFVTDGTSTLHDYIVASGLLNGGGQVPGVSNYVVYGPAPTPTPTPTEVPTSTPTPSPTPEPSPTPTVSPSPSATATPAPSPTPTLPPSETPSPTPSPTSTPTPTPETTATPSPTPAAPTPTAEQPGPTPPETDTAPTTGTSDLASFTVILILVIAFGFGIYAMTNRIRNRP